MRLFHSHLNRRCSFIRLPVLIAALSGICLAAALSSCSSTGLPAGQTQTAALNGLDVRPRSVSWTSQANYLVFLPAKYHAGHRRWPVILFLHGIGECGTDIWLTAKYGPMRYVEKHPDFPFIVVAPQCPIGTKWSNQAILNVLDDAIARYSIDTNRIYLTGLSQGGFGVWNLATTFPGRFAAVAPISGGGDILGFIICRWNPERTKPLQDLPVWAFHGAKDPVVPVSEDKRMVAALKHFGDTDVRLTVYPNGEHNVWDETYANPKLYQWFLKHSLTNDASP